MPYNNSRTRDYLSNPGQSYRYNAYGAAESQRVQNNLLEDYVDDREYFFNRHWNWAIAQATEMFRPIAEKFGESNVQFSPSKNELVVEDATTINNICQDVVGPRTNGNYFGCTTQESWQGQLDKPYIKPLSTTYLAEKWALKYVANAAHHELSHQALISVRQMLQKDHARRKKYNESPMNDMNFNAFMDVLANYDKELDNMDKAWIDSKTGKIVIDQKSDVWPWLQSFVDLYCEYIQKDSF